MTTRPTAADLVRRACADEVGRRQALPVIQTGQIADSYDTLHGVRFIAMILESIPSTVSEEDRLHYSLYLFDAFITHNLRELSDRAAAALANSAISAAADALAWMERLLRLMHDAGGLFPPLSAGSPSLEEHVPVAAFQASFGRLCEALQSRFSRDGPPFSEDSTPLSLQLLHQSKTLILQVRETVLNAQRARPLSIDAHLADAHLECVAAASLGIALNQSTDLNQFCLLHQLPELLAPLALRAFNGVERRIQNPGSAMKPARLAGDLLFLITTSLWPLIERLQPNAYYAFRENLGATSGSSSAAIRGKLLTSAYVRLANVFMATAQDAPADEQLDLAREIARIRRLIYRWRGLHMALPRNVLGANGTKSLMGSPDALKAVETMADAFSKRDPLTARFGPASTQDFEPGGAVAALDRWLLAATGDVAQQRFRQVQERTGPWRKTQKAG